MRDIVIALEDRSTTSESLIEAYLGNIERNNIKGVRLRAVIETAPRDKLVEQAKRLDQERARGHVRSRLHGIPILVKDVVGTHPDMGMETTGGLIAFRGSRLPANAAVIDLLHDAGIIIIGKANLTVLGNTYGSDTPGGWSPAGGQTLSPYGPGRLLPGGSSSGSAVGVAAGFCAASIGEETLGSIMSPSKEASLFAMKPTVGLVPGEGVITITHRADCLGPMCKSAWDVAALLETMVPKSRSLSYVQYTGAPCNEIGRYKLGIVRKDFPADAGLEDDKERGEEVKANFERSIGLLRHAGGRIVDPADFSKLGELRDGPFYADMYGAMNDWLAWIKNCDLHTIEDLVEWNERHPDQAFIDPKSPGRQASLRQVMDTKGDMSGTYHEELEENRKMARHVKEAFEQHEVDALIFPAPLKGGTKTLMIPASGGFPIATVPLGVLEIGRPYGMYILGQRGAEGTLLGIMAACEKIFPPRHVPPLLNA